ncbi:MAG: ribose 5-phosphate isomerase B [Clostridia bacterium]
MIAISSDHAGFQLKQNIISHLKENGIAFTDFGPCDAKSVDFPDYASKVALAIMNKHCDQGILICGTGIGMSIAANKFPGIRAALCTSMFQARMSRLHNDANILVLAGRVTAPDFSIAILKEWLGNAFLGGKYEGRNEKITNIEESNNGGKNDGI